MRKKDTMGKKTSFSKKAGFLNKKKTSLKNLYDFILPYSIVLPDQTPVSPHHRALPYIN